MENFKKYTVNELRSMPKNTIIKIGQLPDNNDLFLMNLSQDVKELKSYIPKTKNYDSFFVEIQDGDYIQVWGFYGGIPYMEKSLKKIL